MLLASPGVVAMAVEGAGDVDDRVRGAGLDLIASLALLPANRAALAETASVSVPVSSKAAFSPAWPLQLVSRVASGLSKGEVDSETLAASTDVVRSLLNDQNGYKAVMAAIPDVSDRLWEVRRCFDGAAFGTDSWGLDRRRGGAQWTGERERAGRVADAGQRSLGAISLCNDADKGARADYGGRRARRQLGCVAAQAKVAD